MRLSMCRYDLCTLLLLGSACIHPALCQAGFWAFTDLTYAYDDVLNGNLPASISPMQIEDKFEDALEVWTNYSLLTFTQVARSASPNIIITHADLDVLGQGTIVGDNWTGSATTLMDDSNYTWAAHPLRGVAAHEFGHNLGMVHWDGGPSVMNTFYTNANGDQVASGQLFPHDISEVQNRYGVGNGFVQNSRYWNGPAGGDWNTGAHWLVAPGTTRASDPAFRPSNRSHVKINQSTATLNPGSYTVRSLVVGESPGQSGQLEINGSALRLTDSASVRVGSAATLTLRGSGSLNARGAAALDGNTRLVGPSVSFQASNINFGNGHVLSAEITDPLTHSPLSTAGSATLGGTVTAVFNGFTPSVGHSWDLVDAGFINSEFASVNTPTALPRGQTLYLDTVPGGVNGQVLRATLENQLGLLVNTNTGATSIENYSTTNIEHIDSYLITSPSDALDPNAWTSLASSDPDWEEANPLPTHLSELNLTGSRQIGTGQSLNLGNVHVYTPEQFGDSPESLEFQYHLAAGKTRSGSVEFTGNNLVLRVDPNTGLGLVVNPSRFDVAIDGYFITSQSGSLDPDAWTSLASSDPNNWEEANPLPTHLSELSLHSSQALLRQEWGAPISLGAMYDFDDPNVQQDLTFEFHLFDANDPGTIMTGVVEYAPVIINPSFFWASGPGDWSDPNGWNPATGPPGAGDDAFITTNGTTVVTVSGNETAANTSVSAGELRIGSAGNLTSVLSLTGGSLTGDGTLVGNVVNNEGILSPGSNGSSATSVPEPTTSMLAILSVLGLGLSRPIFHKSGSSRSDDRKFDFR